MMNNYPYIRNMYFICFLLAVVLLNVAYYLEYMLKILPCPLCVLQRYVLIFLTAIFLTAGLVKQRFFAILLNLLALFGSVLGLLLSGRQVWLQHAPPEGLGECGVSLSFMFKIFSFKETLVHVWRGGTECSQYDWTFLSLSLAEWSCLWFGIFTVFMLIQLKKLCCPHKIRY